MFDVPLHRDEFASASREMSRFSGVDLSHLAGLVVATAPPPARLGTHARARLETAHQAHQLFSVLAKKTPARFQTHERDIPGKTGVAGPPQDTRTRPTPPRPGGGGTRRRGGGPGTVLRQL